MKILITGAEGFLGKEVTTFFSAKKDTVVKKLGRGAACDYRFDLAVDKVLLDDDFDVVIHVAGKAHFVPKTEEEAKQFFDVNVKGTVNLLNALEKSPVGSFIFISSVAVYGIDKGTDINEETPLLAVDPYGKSKIAAETHIIEWCKKHNTHCVILRLPLLIGPDAPGNLGAMVKGIQKGYYFNIGKGDAKKSMVLTSDIPFAIEAAIGKTGIFNLTDGANPSFSELSKAIAQKMGKQRVPSMPHLLAMVAAKLGDLLGQKSPLNTRKFKKITANLTFDDTKAREQLNWRPSPVLNSFSS